MILPVLLVVASVATSLQTGSVVVRKTVASGVEAREGSSSLASASQLETRLAQMEVTIRSLQRRLEVRGHNGPVCVCNGSEVLDQIQEDILHNKEDIADLRINHDFFETKSYEAHTQITKDHNTDMNTLGNSIAKNALDISATTSFLALSLHPVGSILAWMGAALSNTEIPAGWQRCDGSAILRGRLTGRTTPDLNSAGLFLRGAAEEAVGDVEEDAVQEHHHVDGGHTHTGNEHNHAELEHSHLYRVSGGSAYQSVAGADNCDNYDIRMLYDADTTFKYYCMNWVGSTAEAKAGTLPATGTVNSGVTGLGGVDGGRDGARSDGETRPKNMKVVYIMRIE